jgi:hypothetical protein
MAVLDRGEERPKMDKYDLVLVSISPLLKKSAAIEAIKYFCNISDACAEHTVESHILYPEKRWIITSSIRGTQMLKVMMEELDRFEIKCDTGKVKSLIKCQIEKAIS